VLSGCNTTVGGELTADFLNQTGNIVPNHESTSAAEEPKGGVVN